MKLQRRRFMHLASVAAALAALSVTLSSQCAWSQTTRTIKIVVPAPPGGAADIVARLLGEQIERARRLAVVLENRPGAGTVIGTEAVARAAPDGSTLLIVANAFVTIPHLRKLNYDPLSSFEPICYLTKQPSVIAVNGSSGYRTLADLIDAARAKPGNLTLASAGPATGAHIAFEMLKRAAGVNIIFVPYAGAAPPVTALLGGHVTSGLLLYPLITEHLKTGKLRALATASPDRIESLPDTPTVAESGYKDVDADIWFGLVAPAMTAKQTVSELADWLSAAIRVPEVNVKLVTQGLYPAVMCGIDFAAFLRKQYDQYGRVIHEADIKAE
jgi:tripartite-type tricarboxylate transporter receptor subunit TctC